jgi:hypothetical protein
VLAAELRQLGVAEPADRRPVDEDLAGGGPVEAGEDVHERRLARAGRAHDGGELAACDVERDAAEGVDGGVALAVAAGDLARRDNGAVDGSASGLRCDRGFGHAAQSAASGVALQWG